MEFDRPQSEMPVHFHGERVSARRFCPFGFVPEQIHIIFWDVSCQVLRTGGRVAACEMCHCVWMRFGGQGGFRLLTAAAKTPLPGQEPDNVTWMRRNAPPTLAPVYCSRQRSVSGLAFAGLTSAADWSDGLAVRERRTKRHDAARYRRADCLRSNRQKGSA